MRPLPEERSTCHCMTMTVRPGCDARAEDMIYGIGREMDNYGYPAADSLEL
jgi:hypothetical protein